MIKGNPVITVVIVFLSGLALATAVFSFGYLYMANEEMSMESESVLAERWQFKGDDNFFQKNQDINPKNIIGRDTIAMSYDLHGVCIYSGPASAITFIASDGRKYSRSLSEYAENCLNGQQDLYIRLDDFDIDQPLENINSVSVSFWYPAEYLIDIFSISASDNLAWYDELPLMGLAHKLFPISQKKIVPVSVRYTQPYRRLPPPKKSPSLTPSPSPTAVAVRQTPKKTITPKPSPTPAPTQNLTPSPTLVLSPTLNPTVQPTQTPTPVTQSVSGWNIRSVSSMKETKDKLCGQDDVAFIDKWVLKAVELGVNYVAVETPYDSPACGDTIKYAKVWTDAIRKQGLNVWHRHMPLAFEGIYDTAKNNSTDYLPLISNYIKTNPALFKAGDIFTPIPEPQNGGIKGVTYCPQNICMFNGPSEFNVWLRNAISVSESAFASIGLAGQIKIGYYGFDGFVAWGDNNPDWEGILEDATISAMGNITIDHYPEIVGDTMENDLNELQAKYPGIPVIIGEWGTITGGNTVNQVNTSMKAALRKNVVGFNYWHQGMGGNEALIDDDFSSKAQFDAVKSFFRNSFAQSPDKKIPTWSGLGGAERFLAMIGLDFHAGLFTNIFKSF